MVLLSDEIYGELHHKGQHVSIARFYPEGTIVSGGLIKWCGAGGWRLGTFSLPAELALAARRHGRRGQRDLHLDQRADPVRGGPRLRGRSRDRALPVALAAHPRRPRPLVRHAGFPGPGSRLPEPQGAFYLFPDFSSEAQAPRRARHRDLGRALHRLLEDTGVAILPGSDFGRPPEELTARLAYVDFDGARALAAAERWSTKAPLGERFLREYTGAVVEAIDLIVGWIDRRPRRQRSDET